MKAAIKKTIEEWFTKSKELKALKKEEIALRKSVIETVFGDLTSGTGRSEVTGGVLKCTKPLTYSVDTDIVPSDHEEWMTENNIPSNVFVTKYSLKKAVYNDLSKAQKAAFDERFLTIKPGSPTLEIIVPD